MFTIAIYAPDEAAWLCEVHSATGELLHTTRPVCGVGAEMKARQAAAVWVEAHEDEPACC